MKKIATLHNNFFEKITIFHQKFNLIVSEEKSEGCHLKKNGDDVIAQKPMTPFKQIACVTRWHFCK
jgi:hypothetical protein